MRYADFLEEAYASLRASAPIAAVEPVFSAWVVSIGSLLHGLPKDLAAYWIEQYATLLIVKYPHITQHLAYVCLRHAVTEAEAGWPQPFPGVGA